MKKFDKTNFIIVLFVSISICILILSIYTAINVSHSIVLPQTKPKTIVKTYEKNRVVYFESDYSVADKFSLNKEASLEMINSEKDIYFVYLAHDQRNYRSFDDYVKKILDANAEIYGASKEVTSDLTIDGKAGKTTSYLYTKDGLEMFIKIFLYQDGNSFNEFIMWGESNNKDLIVKDLTNLKID